MPHVVTEGLLQKNRMLIPLILANLLRETNVTLMFFLMKMYLICVELRFPPNSMYSIPGSLEPWIYEIFYPFYSLDFLLCTSHEEVVQTSIIANHFLSYKKHYVGPCPSHYVPTTYHWFLVE